jgi:glycosyltransferase involved in cell wall biosynthesis
MVDLATLRGLRPDLGQIPTVLYFHENQFAYPTSAEQHPSIDPQVVQLYAALSADIVVFNSAWNRDSFLQGVERLCRSVPDHCPPDLAARLRPRCRLLPVPVKPITPGTKQGRLILWNHRWEYDKAPQVFAEAIAHLVERGLQFDLALLGPRAAAPPPALTRIRATAGARIQVDAPVADAEYRSWLARADIVVGCAIHEFQGLAVLEAVSAGAVPLVPDALCYVEQYPDAYRYPPGDAEALADRLAEWLQDPPAVPDISAFLEDDLYPQWNALLQRLLD